METDRGKVVRTKVEKNHENESEKGGRKLILLAPLTEPYLFDGFEYNSITYNPKDDDLYLIRLKP